MTDRELLELAAKAAGYEYAKHGGYIVVDGIPGNWNPLTDDGDALRLAVKLRMVIEINDGAVIAATENEIGGTNEPEYVYVDGMSIGVNKGDPYAATRRVIVLAAAEIGASL